MELLSYDTQSWNSLSKQVRNYATQFLGFSKGSTENTVSMCEVLFQAKNALTGPEFDQLCNAVGYETQHASIKKFIKIGEYAANFRPYLDRLPNTWTTLYEITHLPAEDFVAAVSQGRITAATRGTDIRAITNKSVAPLTPIPKITLVLDQGTSKKTIRKIERELEAMRIEYKFEIEVNATAKTAG